MSTILWISSIVLVVSLIFMICGIMKNHESFFACGFIGIFLSFLFGFFLFGTSIQVGDPKFTYEKPDSFFKDETCLVIVVDGQSYSTEKARTINNATKDNARLETEIRYNSYGKPCGTWRRIVILNEDQLKSLER